MQDGARMVGVSFDIIQTLAENRSGAYDACVSSGIDWRTSQYGFDGAGLR
jgi:hypothetical protein